MSVKSRIFISSITLTNYRMYAGANIIELSDNPDRPITIIHGEMGVGKTTILDAVYWCLYGEERSKKGNDFHPDEGIINKNALEGLKEGEKGETSVEVILNDDEGPLYKIIRTLMFEKKSISFERRYNKLVGANIDSSFSITPEVLLTIRKSSGGGDEDYQNYRSAQAVESIIENIFPRAMSSYFLFDAELLNDFFTEREREHVKNGIEIISGLPVIDKAIKNFEKLADEIQRSMLQGDVNIRPSLEARETIRGRLVNMQSEYDSLDEEVKKHQAEISSIGDYLSNYNDEEINRKQEEFDSCETKIEEENNAIKQLEERIKEFLLDSLPKIMLRDTFDAALKIFEQGEKEGKIPAPISKLAIMNILRGNPPVCICGTTVQDGSEQMKRLIELRDLLFDSPLVQEISFGRGILSALSTESNPDERYGDFNNLTRLRAESRERLRTIKEKKKKVQRWLESSNKEEVQRKSAERTHHEENRRIKTMKMGGIEERIGIAKAALNKIEQEIREASELKAEYEVERKKIKLINVFTSILKQVRKELVDDLRNTAEEVTTKYFVRLVADPDFYKVKILQNYETRAVDKNELAKNLSKGQSHCLALSYIAAIREITSRNYFMMIDSPFHNISQAERIEVAKNLAKYLPHTQITLLVQGQEYTGSSFKNIEGEKIPSVRETFQKNNAVWREYIIEKVKNISAPSPIGKITLLDNPSGET